MRDHSKFFVTLRMFYVTCLTVFILKIETVTVIGPLTGEVEW